MQENCESARIHRKGAEPEQVRRDARELTANRAHIMAPLGNVISDAQQLFDGEHVMHVVRQRREVVQPIRVRDELVVSHVLGDFFIAAMEEAHVRIRAGNLLAIELNFQPQHAVGRRMRRPHVQHHFLADRLLRAGSGIAKFHFLRGGHRDYYSQSSGFRRRGSLRVASSLLATVTNGPPSIGAMSVTATSGTSVGLPSSGKSLRKG